MTADWQDPRWEDKGLGAWQLMQGEELVGEAYPLTDGTFKWHCKISDWRDLDSTSIEQAKAECLASFWKENWRKLAEKKTSAKSVEFTQDELAPPTTDFEQMCRDHFNEPILCSFDVGRLVGYAEDDRDCYLIVNYPNPVRTVYHTCVGGYYWLDRLRGQHLVISRDGERWDDYYRMNNILSLNGAPEVPEFIVKRFTSTDR